MEVQELRAQVASLQKQAQKVSGQEEHIAALSGRNDELRQLLEQKGEAA